MTIFIICLVIVVVMVGTYWWLLDETATCVNGVWIRLADQKHFAGFYVAVDQSRDDVVVVGINCSEVLAEVVRHGLLERVQIVQLPGEPNKLMLKLIEPQQFMRKRCNDASLN